jgi:hypothetical protein
MTWAIVVPDTDISYAYTAVKKVLPDVLSYVVLVPISAITDAPEQGSRGKIGGMKIGSIGSSKIGAAKTGAAKTIQANRATKTNK